MNKYDVSEKFYNWINQRPGLSWYDYGDYSTMKQEYRHIAQQKKRALAALALFNVLPYDENALKEAMRSFSGRLSFNDAGNLEYVTGQYWPTEYRLAAAVCLEAYVFYITRNNRKACMTIFKYFNVRVKSGVRKSITLAKQLSKLDVHDYQKRNKILDKFERDNKPESLYHAYVGLAYEYKRILFKSGE